MSESPEPTPAAARPGIEAGLEALPPEILDRIPPRFRATVVGLQGLWPGRIVLRSMAKFAKLELFDRSMTIAAQFFTSVFPVLILFGIVLGHQESGTLAEVLNLPSQTRNVLEDATEGTSTSTFGVIGALIVFISGTSLSRALTRASAVIWRVPRPKNRLGSVWRWLAVLLVVAVFLVLPRGLSIAVQGLPPPGLWLTVVLFIANTALAIFIPWLLLEGRVGIRLMAPGAVLFATVMALIRPVSRVALPRALDSSAEHYGSIGVAFTYLTFLYIISWIFLAAAALGQVIATDRGAFAAWIRHGAPIPGAPVPGSPTPGPPGQEEAARGEYPGSR
ncbi:YhjD/YihY/BrkB family envelope integrity protein [Nocardioides sp.]|uniref:YhjD/YihY/BrkB family envelope integrity protein n=1 Tax=Nocardioides sp. TaxID=35761 RepID=UPI003D0B86A5